MNSTGLLLFHALCDVGNALEAWRETYAPASDDWCALTQILQDLDASIDILVHSSGVGGADDA